MMVTGTVPFQLFITFKYKNRQKCTYRIDYFMMLKTVSVELEYVCQ